MATVGLRRFLGGCGGVVVIVAFSACSLLDCFKTDSREADPPKPAPLAEVSPKVQSPPMPETKPSPFDRIGEVGVISLEIPDIEGLTATDRRRISDMTRAARMTETVNFALSGPKILRIKRVLEGVLTAKARVPSPIYEKIEPYANRFFLNGGPIDTFTGERIRPGFIPGELAAAAKAAVDSGIDLGVDEFEGADLGANRLEQLEALLAYIRKPIFGVQPGVKETGTDDSDTDTTDDDLTAFLSALAEIAAIIESAEKPLDEGPDKAQLSALLSYLRSPSRTSFSTFTEAYTADTFNIETFIGPFGPAQGIKQERRFQGFVAIRDRDQSALLEKLAAEIPYFERRLPGNAMFRRGKKDISLPAAAAYYLVAAAPFGAISLPAFRFPAPAAIQSGGGKAMVFTNVLDAEDDAQKDVLIEFHAKDGASRGRMSKWRRAASTAFWVFKYVVGYGLGTRKEDASEEGQTLRWLTTGRAMAKEMHADLATLHFMFDPKLQSLGLVPETECALAVVDRYFAQFLAESPIEASPATPEGRAIVARRIVTRQLLNTSGIRVGKEEGHYVILLEDEEALRTGIGELFVDAQRMVSLGEEKNPERLLVEKGGPLPKAWRDDATTRFEALGIPLQWTFRYPDTIKPDTIKDVARKTRVKGETEPASIVPASSAP